MPDRKKVPPPRNKVLSDEEFQARRKRYGLRPLDELARDRFERWMGLNWRSKVDPDAVVGDLSLRDFFVKAFRAGYSHGAEAMRACSDGPLERKGRPPISRGEVTRELLRAYEDPKRRAEGLGLPELRKETGLTTKEAYQALRRLLVENPNAVAVLKPVGKNQRWALTQDGYEMLRVVS